MIPPIDHHILRTPTPPTVQAGLYEYLLAGNGVFVRGQRDHLSACLPVALGTVRGLPLAAPGVQLQVPRVPAGAVATMLERARTARDARGRAIEILYHLEWLPEPGCWRLYIPPQEGSGGHVRPTESGATSSYARALIEVHSHHDLAAYWSPTDDADERSGFRLYGVLGQVRRYPVLRVRVGLHGYFMEVPATQIFDLPPDVHPHERRNR